jgi:hypothetical protein
VSPADAAHSAWDDRLAVGRERVCCRLEDSSAEPPQMRHPCERTGPAPEALPPRARIRLKQKRSRPRCFILRGLPAADGCRDDLPKKGAQRLWDALRAVLRQQGLGGGEAAGIGERPKPYCPDSRVERPQLHRRVSYVIHPDKIADGPCW